MHQDDHCLRCPKISHHVAINQNNFGELWKWKERKERQRLNYGRNINFAITSSKASYAPKKPRRKISRDSATDPRTILPEDSLGVIQRFDEGMRNADVCEKKRTNLRKPRKRLSHEKSDILTMPRRKVSSSSVIQVVLSNEGKHLKI